MTDRKLDFGKYLYSGMPGYFQRHLIVKRTARRITYEMRGERIDDAGRSIEAELDAKRNAEIDVLCKAFGLPKLPPLDPHEVADGAPEQVGVVDRRPLEETGVAPGRQFTTLYRSLADYRPFSLADYLPHGDVASLKAAMAAAHPDHGGSAAAFIQARTAYVAARRLARNRRTR